MTSERYDAERLGRREVAANETRGACGPLFSNNTE
jgi:hypothetical protein